MKINSKKPVADIEADLACFDGFVRITVHIDHVAKRRHADADRAIINGVIVGFGTKVDLNRQRVLIVTNNTARREYHVIPLARVVEIEYA